ncbi:MAG: D-galactarate dehydratase [Pseudomonadota bacterium]
MTRQLLVGVLSASLLAGCAQLAGPDGGASSGTGPALDAAQTLPDGADPAPGTEAGAPPAGAVTVEQFDTTTAAEREAAAATTGAATEDSLGTTVATLGDPALPGFWAETPLVTNVRQGRLTYAATGQSVKVELRPSGGAPGSGTRVSLPAMRVLQAPLTALAELTVVGL